MENAPVSERLNAPSRAVSMLASACIQRLLSHLVHVRSHVVPCMTGAVRLQLFSVLHSGQFHNMVEPSPTSVGSFCSGSIRSSFPLKVRRQLQSKPRTAPPKTLSGNSKRRGTAQDIPIKAELVLDSIARSLTDISATAS